MALESKTDNMKSYKNLYPLITSEDNLLKAYKKARKRKTTKPYVIEFRQNLIENLQTLRTELLLHSYKPKSLETFIVRDPKTRVISKSDFRDRIIHHALINILEPIFDKTFIHDSYANRKIKGTLASLQRFDYFKRKVSRNGKTKGCFNKNQVKGYCLKADIKHYFEEIDHKVLLNIIKRKIKCRKTIWLIKQILKNYSNKQNINKGIPLGNLTSQFFANVYLNELDQFVKNKLKSKYYMRYVDDFVILHKSKNQLKIYKKQIDKFLNNDLGLELHSDKSRIISLSKPIPFVGFRVFYYHKLLKKSNQRNIQKRLDKFKTLFSTNQITYDKIYESIQGFIAYTKHANTYNLRRKILKKREEYFPNEMSSIEINRYLKYQPQQQPHTLY